MYRPIKKGFGIISDEKQPLDYRFAIKKIQDGFIANIISDSYGNRKSPFKYFSTTYHSLRKFFKKIIFT